jgi:hypothetical protein
MRGGGEQGGARRRASIGLAARALACAAAAALLAAAARGDADPPPYPLAPDREMSPDAALNKLPEGMRRPKIDGRLDDAAWEHATALGPLTQQSPHEGAEPTFPTDVKVLFDDKYFYVSVRAWDPEPEKLITKVMRRDTSQRSDDRVLITIDTFHDRRNGYMFSTNPNSGRYEALIENNQTVRTEWDGIWFAKARIDAEGWTAEFAFPFQSLAFDPAQTTWGFNVTRSVRRINEESRWASWRQNKFPLDMSEAGTLTGIEGVVPGIGLDVVPYGAVGGFAERNVDEIHFPPKQVEHRDYATLDPGLDVYYKLTPSITGALTFNTDFSDSDVDARQVNLDRFALFFPETRDFFLQDAGIFDFGGIGEQVQFNEISNPNGMPFFTRKIGIYSDPIGVAGSEILDIRAGAKVTGRVGALNFGAMNVQLEDFGLHCDLDAPVLLRGFWECGREQSAARETAVGVGNKNLSVARAKWNFGAESTAGAIATYGDPNSPGTASTLGVDFRLRSSHVFGEQIAELIGWAQRSSLSGEARAFRLPPDDPRRQPGTQLDGIDDQAYGLRFRYPNDHWFVDTSWARIGEHFDPALGFVNRPGVDQFHTFVRRRWRPASGYVRFYDVFFEGDLVQGEDGHLQTLVLNPTFLEIHNALDDYVYVGAEWRSEVISDFDTFPDCTGFYINETPLICIPGIRFSTGGAPRRYDWQRAQLGFGTAQSRPVAANLDYSYGGFFGGTLHSVEANLELRLSKHFFGQIEFIENIADLPASYEVCIPGTCEGSGDFTQRLVKMRAQIIFTPDISWDTFVQYDNLSDSVGWNSRLRWIFQPGNELVIIWNQAQGANLVEGEDFRFQAFGLTTKLSWTFRF